MSSQDEIVNALTSFYRQVLRHPYLNESNLKIPPEFGWDTINVESLRKLGKNQTVVELLKRLPYLESGSRYERLLIGYETAAIAYTQTSRSFMEEVTPLPGHCVYLTEGVDREGYSLILDTENGRCSSPVQNLTMRSLPLTSLQGRSQHTVSPATRSNPMPSRATIAYRRTRNGEHTEHHQRLNSS